MRTIVSGPVSAATLEMAEVWGITPTSFVTNGLRPAPKLGLPVDEYPVCKMITDHDAAVRARNYTLVQNADALVLVGRDDHLARLAENYGLAIFQDC